MPTVLHIGFNKTATTTLQRHVFAREEGWRAVIPDSDDGLMEALSTNLWASPEEEYRGLTFAGYLADRRRDTDAFVVSHEGFGWHPHDGRTAGRLRALLPDAQVLAVVRDQRTMLRSLYFMYLSRGGVVPFDEWVTSDRLRSEKLQFDVTVSQYQAAFGPELVRVLVYEDFVADPVAFVRDVVALVRPDGAPDVAGWRLPVVNPSLSSSGLAALRTVNRWFVRSDANARPVVPVLPVRGPQIRWLRTVDARLGLARRGRGEDHALPTELVAWIEASNRRLEQTTGLDLGSRGYLVGPP